MIGKVAGRIDYIAEDHVLIDASGVGYAVYCSPATLRALPGSGEVAALYTDMVVREDLLQLYGFPTLGEREWHRVLTSVQGVGAKVSLAMLGTLGIGGLTRALAAGDAMAIKATPGVGPKLATRIVTELKGKAPAMMALAASGQQAATPLTGHGGADAPPHSASPQLAASAPVAEDGALAASAGALSALVNLGYDRMEAAEAVADASRDAADEASLIRAALRLLGKNL
ncbi:MAG: Holliday junction branch migration protein RuvA [Paracoccaceae bacterium]